MAKPIKETPILTSRDAVDFFKSGCAPVKKNICAKTPLEKEFDSMLKTGSFGDTSVEYLIKR